jgi:hypothetical protein
MYTLSAWDPLPRIPGTAKHTACNIQQFPDYKKSQGSFNSVPSFHGLDESPVLASSIMTFPSVTLLVTLHLVYQLARIHGPQAECGSVASSANTVHASTEVLHIRER